MARVDVSSFDQLRTWNGEQSRAFEEISYQLLKYQVPAGTRAIRTGNPDGGVEWYATLPDGTEWGWQAKHVHGIDALLNAMTDSVKRVAKERPQSPQADVRYLLESEHQQSPKKRQARQVAAREVRRQDRGLAEDHPWCGQD